MQVEYPQDRLTDPVETQAEWRSDPSRSGAGGTIGDIGPHADHLAGFVTGLRGAELAADLQRFGAGRELDDNAHILRRFEGGARGMLWCSQIVPGCDNELRLRVYGERGGLDWAHEDPNHLWFTPHGEPTRRLTRDGAGAKPASRVPPGHPEGYLEGLPTIYTEAAAAIRAIRGCAPRETVMGKLTGISAGMKGMADIRACVTSARDNAASTRI